MKVAGTWQVWDHEGRLMFIGDYDEANAYAKAKGISPLNVTRDSWSKDEPR